ncbi:MAG: hypothetical protein QOH88_3126 [Verrucomicrobiota bacterium]|jgi:hypothetical protein
MKSLVVAPLFGLLFLAQEVSSALSSDSLSCALAETPQTVFISIPKTDVAVDGGSILNDIRFSDGRLYTLSLDFPVDLATDKLIYPEIHFTIFIPKREPPRLETLTHGSAGELRLIELLKSLIGKTKNPREKKNAASLVEFLKDRHRPFPRAHGGKWDLTPPTYDY